VTSAKLRQVAERFCKPGGDLRMSSSKKPPVFDAKYAKFIEFDWY